MYVLFILLTNTHPTIQFNLENANTSITVYIMYFLSNDIRQVHYKFIIISKIGLNRVNSICLSTVICFMFSLSNLPTDDRLHHQAFTTVFHYSRSALYCRSHLTFARKFDYRMCGYSSMLLMNVRVLQMRLRASQTVFGKKIMQL
jgi:hypothetical protein